MLLLVIRPARPSLPEVPLADLSFILHSSRQRFRIHLAELGSLGL